MGKEVLGQRLKRVAPCLKKTLKILDLVLRKLGQTQPLKLSLTRNAKQTCRSFYTSLSLIPPDPRLLLTSFPILPKNLAPCWTTPSSDCENRNVILSLFETMVILSSILKKCQKSTTFENCEISTYFCFVLCWCEAEVRKSAARRAEYQSWLTQLADENNNY